MSYNGSGDYSLPAGQPVVTGTTISSTTHNNLANDLATGFDTAFCRDGQAAATALWDMGGFRITNLGAATGVAHAVIASQIQNNSMTLLSAVAGTNTVTGTASPTPSAYASGQNFILVPANTNTGATTLNVSSIGAKNIFFAGAACVGGELAANIPALVEYDGTQFHIVGNGFLPRQITLGTEQATTSGTSIDFTGIPSWVKKIIIQFVGVSTNGTSNLLIRIGDSGGIETASYAGAGSGYTSGAAPSVTNYTAGFGITTADAANVLHGAITLTLEDSSDNTWACVGTLALSNAASMFHVAGTKSLSATLDRVRLTTVNGTDAFDAGAVNILYE